MTISTVEYNACFACSVGLYEECMNLQPIDGDPDHFLPCYGRVEVSAQIDQSEKRPVGRPVVTDFSGHTEEQILATGRKRALMMYPIHEGMICEWAGLLYAGGGVETIIGCRGNLATDRHHGPDKSVVSNEPGNVHRICSTCHHRFHTLNDPYYGERTEAGKPYLPEDYDVQPHDAMTKATPEDIEQNEAWWAMNPAKRVEED